MNIAVSLPPTMTNENLPYAPPRVYKGQIVMRLRPGKELDECVAIVQRVNADGSIALSLIPAPYGGNPGTWIDQSAVSVLHKDDPRLRDDYRSRYGCWDLTEPDRQFREMQATIEKLSRKAKSEK